MKFENSKISEIQSETGNDPFQKWVPAIQFQSETGRTSQGSLNSNLKQEELRVPRIPEFQSETGKKSSLLKDSAA